MRQLLIDELVAGDMDRIREWLDTGAVKSSMQDLYWVDLPPDLLDPGQFEEKGDHPFSFAVEVGDCWAKFEFLVRSRHNMNSLHIRYANDAQQKFILNFCHKLISDLELRT